MDDVIEVSLDRVRAIIIEFHDARFSTADVIRSYCGGFFSNSGTPANYSFNAQFGKLLKRNETHLHIEQTEADSPIFDDHGHPTHSSFWRRNA